MDACYFCCCVMQFTVGDAMRCMYCDECVKLADSYKDNPEDDSAVTVRMREDKFIFSVEVRCLCSLHWWWWHWV